jgi:hypothetical protein
MLRAASLLAMVGLVSSAASAYAAQRNSLVGVLKAQNGIDGCSWSASSRAVGKGFVFLAEFDESVVIMNIRGNDVRLRLDASLSNGDLNRVGHRMSRRFVSDSLRVDASYLATWVCPKDSESCEVTKFNVTFVVHDRGETQTLRASGDVGC